MSHACVSRCRHASASAHPGLLPDEGHSGGVSLYRCAALAICICLSRCRIPCHPELRVVGLVHQDECCCVGWDENAHGTGRREEETRRTLAVVTVWQFANPVSQIIQVACTYLMPGKRRRRPGHAEGREGSAPPPAASPPTPYRPPCPVSDACAPPTDTFGLYCLAGCSDPIQSCAAGPGLRVACCSCHGESRKCRRAVPCAPLLLCRPLR